MGSQQKYKGTAYCALEWFFHFLHGSMLFFILFGVTSCSGSFGLLTQTPHPITKTPPPEVTPQPSPTPILEISPTPQTIIEEQITPTSEPSPKPRPDCNEDSCIYKRNFPFLRPIDPTANTGIEFSYLYGSTLQGDREVHHGVEFPNPVGTSVLAAADGKVIVAGQDDRIVYGPYPNFYGNLIIIEHHLPDYSYPIFTLYGHLSEVDVSSGDQVFAGDKIGRVGASGIAFGSHLHFEVRLKKNSYNTTSNPELWMLPLAEPNQDFENGVLSIRLKDDLDRIYEINLSIEPPLKPGEQQTQPLFFQTYGRGAAIEPGLKENFALDLPPGKYRVTFNFEGKVYESNPTVYAGKLTQVKFVLND